MNRVCNIVAVPVAGVLIAGALGFIALDAVTRRALDWMSDGYR